MKNTSTPKNPPPTHHNVPWYSNTPMTATARNPSNAGRYPNRDRSAAASPNATSTEGAGVESVRASTGMRVLVIEEGVSRWGARARNAVFRLVGRATTVPRTRSQGVPGPAKWRR